MMCPVVEMLEVGCYCNLGGIRRTVIKRGVNSEKVSDDVPSGRDARGWVLL